jgi:glutathione S-transferase
MLYYAPQTCALAPFVTLTEAGAEFEVRNINNRKGGNRTPEFLALNPKHKVPVLLIDGEPLTENAAIHVWIDRNFPKARLLPSDPLEYVKAISLHSWCASSIHPRLTPNARPENYCDLPGSEESVKRVATKLLLEDFAIADRLLAGREWFLLTLHRARRPLLLVLPARDLVRDRRIRVQKLHGSPGAHCSCAPASRRSSRTRRR